MKRYYKVIAKRGHVGSGRYLPICFTFVAENIMEAMDRAKATPGVKHAQLILSAVEITYSEYVVLSRVSAYARAEGRA